LSFSPLIITDQRRGTTFQISTVNGTSSKITDEIMSLPPVNIDYITFSGRGEPTLAANLGEMIKAARKIRQEKIAVITNSSILCRKDVTDDLLPADCVVAKLDAYSQKSLDEINRPMEGITFSGIVNSMREFRQKYKGKFAIQIMFMKVNKKHAVEIAKIVRSIKPDEVQINTPLRKCGVKPLPKTEIDKIKKYFAGIDIISVYDVKKKEIESISKKDTLRRRGKI